MPSVPLDFPARDGTIDQHGAGYTIWVPYGERALAGVANRGRTKTVLVPS